MKFEHEGGSFLEERGNSAERGGLTRIRPSGYHFWEKGQGSSDGPRLGISIGHFRFPSASPPSALPRYYATQSRESSVVLVLCFDLSRDNWKYNSSREIIRHIIRGRTRSVVDSFQVKPDTEMVFEQHGLYSVISSLRLQLEPNHFAGDKINVR